MKNYWLKKREEKRDWLEYATVLSIPKNELISKLQPSTVIAMVEMGMLSVNEAREYAGIDLANQNQTVIARLILDHSKLSTLTAIYIQK